MTNIRLKVKVCGMREPDNITSLSQLDIDYIGFIFYQKSTRFIDNIPTVSVPPSIKKTGVFVNESETNVMKKIKEGLQAVQLHGSEPAAFCHSLKKTGVEVIKAFGIHGNFDWQLLSSYTDEVDYFLFDTSSPQHGGTGKAFDWEILNDYPLTTPYFLSGGLSTENIAQALEIGDARLIGLDLNSKFELKPGLKDIDKLKKVLKSIRDE